MKNNSEKYKNIILPLIAKHAPEAKVILYGSRARGDARAGSDIDVALDMGSRIDLSVMSKIMGDLEESNLPIAFDVVDFYGISEKMQQEIVKDGVVWKQ